jgi:hypothetical protein
MNTIMSVSNRRPPYSTTTTDLVNNKCISRRILIMLVKHTLIGSTTRSALLSDRYVCMTHVRTVAAQDSNRQSGHRAPPYQQSPVEQPAPVERPRLNLKPRSVDTPADPNAPAQERDPKIFGATKIIDTDAKIAELEQRLKRDADEKRKVREKIRRDRMCVQSESEQSPGGTRDSRRNTERTLSQSSQQKVDPSASADHLAQPTPPASARRQYTDGVAQSNLVKTKSFGRDFFCLLQSYCV